MTAELAELERRLGAEIVRHVDAAAHGEIGPRASTFHGADGQRLPGLHLERLPERHGRTVNLAPPSPRRSRHEERIRVEAERRPASVISSPAAKSGLPTRRLAKRNERESIGPDGGTPTSHRPRRPGQSCTVVRVPRQHDLEARRMIGERIECSRRDLALGKHLRADQLARGNRGWSRCPRPWSPPATPSSFASASSREAPW